MKRILLWSDHHCGHRYGLAHKTDCVNNAQRKAWAFVEKGLKKYAPFDIVFNNGDLIDGNARKNGGVELITTDRLEQCKMAEKVLREVSIIGNNIPKHYFSRETPYHVGNEENFEDTIAKTFQVNGEKNIDEALFVDVEGVVFHLKHKVGKGANPILKDMELAILKESIYSDVKADVFIRSHIHSHIFIERWRRTAVVTPALEINSAYGQRQCSRLIDFGFLICDVDDGKIVRWIKWIAESPMLKDEVLKA